MLPLLGTCSAQLPGCYQSVDRVTWLVQNIDKAKPGWIALGLTDIQEFPDVKITGQYLGKPITIWTWQLTGHLGNLTIDMIQPAEGQRNAYNDFLDKHHDGIFSIVHEVSSKKELANEIKRMQSLGVGVLQQLTVPRKGAPPITLTYFDTELEGKFALGLVYRPGTTPPPHPQPTPTVSQLAIVVRDPGPISAFWQKLGFPASRTDPATPTIASQHYDQFTYQWIVPPADPKNIYAAFLKAHGEGIQHLGISVDDIDQATAAYAKLGFPMSQPSAHQEDIDTSKIGGISLELIHP